jgi:hypothetical protein
LGRIGFGYVYPNFNAQITYSTPANHPAQLSIGIFDPSVICPQAGCSSAADATYQGTRIPRLEAEFTWTGNFGSSGVVGEMNPANQIMFWVNGMIQNTYHSATPVPSDSSITSSGVGGGIKLDLAGLSIVGSGYFGDGVGTTLMFGQAGGALDPLGDTRQSYGYIGQVTYQPTGSKWMLGASYGDSRLKKSDNDPSDAFNDLVKSNMSIDGMLTYHWTKALQWVGEYTYARAEAFSAVKNSSNQVATGLMLTF